MKRKVIQEIYFKKCGKGELLSEDKDIDIVFIRC